MAKTRVPASPSASVKAHQQIAVEAADPAQRGEPEIPVGILSNGPQVLIHQPVACGDGGETLAVATHSRKTAKPQIAGAVLDNSEDLVVDQPVFLLQSDEFAGPKFSKVSPS
jgi:hypothetical protein